MFRNLSHEQARLLFAVAAIYDIALGLAFTFLYDPILDALDIVPPDNKSYIHLASVFVLVQEGRRLQAPRRRRTQRTLLRPTTV